MYLLLGMLCHHVFTDVMTDVEIWSNRLADYFKSLGLITGEFPSQLLWSNLYHVADYIEGSAQLYTTLTCGSCPNGISFREILVFGSSK